MNSWIMTHGVELLMGAYVYSIVISAMPPLSDHAGWWTIFAHNILQVTAANADRVIKRSPVMQRFTSFEEKPNGEKKTETLVVKPDA